MGQASGPSQWAKPPSTWRRIAAAGRRPLGAPAAAVTGSKADLDRLVTQYKAYYEKVDSGSAMGYLIDHTAIVYVIDQQGRVRFLHRHGDGAGRLARAVRQLL